MSPDSDGFEKQMACSDKIDIDKSKLDKIALFSEDKE